ncbi:MAG: LptA/OstA family protein [Alphaproteobacteria bacterium]
MSGLARLGRAMAVALGLAGAMPGIPASFAAQSLGIGGDSNKPIQVYADDGIEWNQNTRQYIARGNAKAIQGTTTVYGDTLIAYYEEIAGGNTEIYRLDAVGRVRIVSPTETAYGDKGVYDVRKGVLVLTGKALRFETDEEIITARDSLEYYEEKSLAVARGDAVSRPVPAKRKSDKENRTVRADVLTAHFRDNEAGGGKSAKTGKTTAKKKAAASGGGGNSVDRMDAYGNVVVTRPGEVAFGDRGVYLPDTEMVHLWGKVRITREDNQINGNYAEVNFRTGISRILASPSDPVRALIEMDKAPKKGSPAR